MDSERFQTLKERIAQLRKHLLPVFFDPTGEYADDEGARLKALAFRALAHAEFETYFEDRVIEIADVTHHAWKASRYVSQSTIHLLAFSGRQMTPPPDSLAPPSENKRKGWPDLLDIDERIRCSITDFRFRISDRNHGVKEEHILSMLLPIGVHHSKCDGLLLANFNDFGAKRGEVVHGSNSPRVQQAIDPKTEYSRVEELISQLTSLDAELTCAFNEAQPSS